MRSQNVVVGVHLVASPGGRRALLRSQRIPVGDLITPACFCRLDSWAQLPNSVRQVQGGDNAANCDRDVEEREKDGHEYDPTIERTLEFVFGLSFSEHFKSLLQDFGPQSFTCLKKKAPRA